jgi:hypothetical protein
VCVALAALGTGCANGPVDTSAPSGTTAAGSRDQTVKFAECMRSHGIAAFPDPEPSGELTIDAIANGKGVDVSSAAFTQAMSACKDLVPSGFTGHKRSAQEQEDALRFAQCIREHGVRDFPDPAPDAPLVDTNRIPSSGGKGGMTTLNAAMKACGPLMGGAVGPP